MSICSAYLLKGWLLAERAPAEVMEAVESVIKSIATATNTEPAQTPPVQQPQELVVTGATTISEILGRAEEVHTTPTDTPPSKKKHIWSPEARAAAAERMRKQRAAGMGPQKRALPTQTPSAKQNWAYGKPTPVTPHGETSTIIDPDGRKVTKLPPGYAIGAEPDQKVRPKNGYGA